MKIKVGYVLSYDYNMFLTSVDQLYQFVDKIFVAIDKDRKSWSGNDFEIPDSFFKEVKLYDVKNKIEFYFDSFYVPELKPMQCETRERNLLLKKMGKGWLMQVDVDEYIYDFEKIVMFLRKHWYLNVFPKLTPVVFKGVFVTLFKELSDGYLFIENNERFLLITNCTRFDVARNKFNASSHLTGIKVIHQSWARTEEQILLKINNWGHSDDFNTQEYFKFWKNLDSVNFSSYKNIHPLTPQLWDKLYFLPCTSINDFINLYGEKNKQTLTHVSLLILVKTAYKRLLNKLNLS